MGDVDAVADRFRAALLAGDRRAAAALLEAYGEAYGRVRAELGGLVGEIAAARARGEDVSAAWLLQRDRLATLERRIAAEIARVAGVAGGLITARQRELVDRARRQAAELVRDALGPPPPGVTVELATLPRGATEALVGQLADGAPLRELLDGLGPEASAGARRALLAGVATGRGAREIARAVRQALGSSLARALTIARTETLRAYREASRQTYLANRDVVAGWVWHAALGRRTCGFCWSMHGTEHPLDEVFSTHPNCRCSPIPVAKSWAELGFPNVPDARAAVELGEALFRALRVADQRAVLGPAKLAAWRAGLISLADLRGFRSDPRWGRVGYERSLAEILGPGAGRRLGATLRSAGPLGRAEGGWPAGS